MYKNTALRSVSRESYGTRLATCAALISRHTPSCCIFCTHAWRCFNYITYCILQIHTVYTFLLVMTYNLQTKSRKENQKGCCYTLHTHNSHTHSHTNQMLKLSVSVCHQQIMEKSSKKLFKVESIKYLPNLVHTCP